MFEDEEQTALTVVSLLETYKDDASNPLVVIGEEILDQLDDDQVKFLLARMATTHDKAACRVTMISPATVGGWKGKNVPFKKAYELITKDPVAFALHVNRFIVAKAAVEHMSLLLHPNVRVRQWAIELAYRNNQVGTSKEVKVSGTLVHDFDKLKELAKETPVVIDGQYRYTDVHELPEPSNSEGRVDEVQT